MEDVTSDPVTRCRGQKMLTRESAARMGFDMALDAIGKKVADIAPNAAIIGYDEAQLPDAARHSR